MGDSLTETDVQRLLQENEDLKAQLGALEGTQAALRRAESKYRSVFENAVEGIFQTTPSGHYLSANPTLARIYGYPSPTELIRDLHNIAETLYVNPDRRTAFQEAVETHGFVTGFESQVRRKDGQVIWISENARSVTNSQGQSLYYEGTVLDITERKESEERRRQLETQLIASERLAAVGTAAAGVVHNIRNPVQVVMGMAELIKAQHPKMKEARSIVDRALEINDMCESILARCKATQPEARLDMNQMVKREIEFLQAGMARERLRVESRLAEDLPFVMAARGDISQVLGNLLRNAVEATALESPRCIQVETVYLDAEVVIQVIDNGSGISEDDLPNLFEPFFTTKSNSGGTGLGLYTTKSLIENAGGRVEVASTLGTGTTFSICLPAA